MKSHYLSLLLLTLLTAVTSTFAAERAVLPTSGGSAQVVPGSRALGRVMPLPSMNDIFGQHMQDCVSAEALFASGFRMGTNGELFVVLNGQGRSTNDPNLSFSTALIVDGRGDFAMRTTCTDQDGRTTPRGPNIGYMHQGQFTFVNDQSPAVHPTLSNDGSATAAGSPPLLRPCAFPNVGAFPQRDSQPGAINMGKLFWRLNYMLHGLYIAPELIADFIDAGKLQPNNVDTIKQGVIRMGHNLFTGWARFFTSMGMNFGAKNTGLRTDSGGLVWAGRGAILLQFIDMIYKTATRGKVRPGEKNRDVYLDGFKHTTEKEQESIASLKSRLKIAAAVKAVLSIIMIGGAVTLQKNDTSKASAAVIATASSLQSILSMYMRSQFAGGIQQGIKRGADYAKKARGKVRKQREA